MQEAQLRAGSRPGEPGFGEEPREAWGVVGSDDDHEPVETARGSYVSFYEQMEQAIRTGGAPPVPLEAGIATLRAIEAARASADGGEVVAL